MFSTPAIFVKAVTDIVDGEKPTTEEFLQNLISVTMALDQAVTEVIDFINGNASLISEMPTMPCRSGFHKWKEPECIHQNTSPPF